MPPPALQQQQRQLAQQQLTPEEVAELRELFTMLDADGGGTLSAAEIRELMRLLGIHMSMQEVRARPRMQCSRRALQPCCTQRRGRVHTTAQLPAAPSHLPPAPLQWPLRRCTLLPTLSSGGRARRERRRGRQRLPGVQRVPASRRRAAAAALQPGRAAARVPALRGQGRAAGLHRARDAGEGAGAGACSGSAPLASLHALPGVVCCR